MHAGRRTSLLPELGMQTCKLFHHVHVWYVHGLSFSVIDVLLLANTKLAFESLHRRVRTHRNFLLRLFKHSGQYGAVLQAYLCMKEINSSMILQDGGAAPDMHMKLEAIIIEFERDLKLWYDECFCDVPINYENQPYMRPCLLK